MKKLFVLGFMLLGAMVCFTACSSGDNATDDASTETRADDATADNRAAAKDSSENSVPDSFMLVDVPWEETYDNGSAVFVYQSDGHLSQTIYDKDGNVDPLVNTVDLNYSVEGSTIHYTTVYGGSDFGTETFAIDGDQLTLTRSDGATRTLHKKR